MSTVSSILKYLTLSALGCIMLVLGIIFLVVFPPLGSSILLVYICYVSFLSYYYGQGFIGDDKKKKK